MTNKHNKAAEVGLANFCFSYKQVLYHDEPYLVADKVSYKQQSHVNM